MSRGFDRDVQQRRSIRLADYDYRQAGAYFVTVVTHERECFFENRILQRVVESNWRAIPGHFANASIDEFVIMPNHVHGIIILDDSRGEAFAQGYHPVAVDTLNQELAQDVSLLANASPLREVTNVSPAPGSLGAIVGNFKSVTARRINAILKTPGGSIWQRNYYEHIVRDQSELDRIREYIAANPEQWEADRENAEDQARASVWTFEERQWFGK